MKGKEAIIDSILNDAKQKASCVIAEAEAQAAAIISQTENKISDEIKRMEKHALAQTKEIMSRKLSVAELETKKYNLSLKQNMLGECFSAALEKLRAMPDKEYLKIIAGLLRYAEDGETVIISKNDVKLIDAEFIKKTVKSKNVVLSKQTGNFSGGIILSKEGYDKNMTFEVLLNQVREESETEVASVLFEEK